MQLNPFWLSIRFRPECQWWRSPVFLSAFSWRQQLSLLTVWSADPSYCIASCKLPAANDKLVEMQKQMNKCFLMVATAQVSCRLRTRIRMDKWGFSAMGGHRCCVAVHLYTCRHCLACRTIKGATFIDTVGAKWTQFIRWTFFSD